jgi:hypothetical protein
MISACFIGSTQLDGEQQQVSHSSRASQPPSIAHFGVATNGPNGARPQWLGRRPRADSAAAKKVRRKSANAGIRRGPTPAYSGEPSPQRQAQSPSENRYSKRVNAGGAVMPTYRLYCLDGAGKMANAEWIDAASDEDAFTKARGKKLSFPCELWEQSRFVGVVAAQARG